MITLRQYDESECNWNGYPRPWAHETPLHQPQTGAVVTLPPIKDYIRELAGHRCVRCGHPYRVGEVGERGEWSPCDDFCAHSGPLRVIEEEVGFPTRIYPCPPWQDVTGLRGGGLSPVARIEARWRILTVHHLDEDKANCRWFNLMAACQRCHLRMQRAVVMDRPWHYEHSAWFRPYAAGFYAWKYLNEDLSREEVEARMDELLALEHRFTQEVLL